MPTHFDAGFEVVRAVAAGRQLQRKSLDDWGLAKPNAENRRDLLEVLEDRHGRRATIAASQLPIEQWHTAIGDPTLADAILDRLIHNAYPINMKGESMRKRQSKLTNHTPSRT